MIVENVARKSLTARGTPQEQGHLAIGGGLFGEIIVNDQRMPLAVAEILTHGTTRIRGNILQRSRVAGTSRHDGGVFHGTMFFEHGVDLCDG